LAAARLALSKGATVTVADSRAEEQLDHAGTAREAGARVLAGGHPAVLAEESDLVVVSPGVPSEIDLLRKARKLRLPVWGEIELAARFCRGRVIGITGSNGKSTVTSMSGEILRAAGLPGGTGGNLATPFCELLSEDGPAAVHALELSSFQLETVESFRPDVAVILNLSPDHLDRYPSYDAYARAKARLFEVQRAEDAAVLNADDPESDRFRAAVRGRLHLFSTRRELERGAFLRGGRLIVRDESGERDLMDATELPVPGEHNVSNALAASLACSLVGCPPEAIVRGLLRYKSLPHRLELVRSVGGVSYYNDSKATNPAAAACAVGSFEPGRILLILGGKDKGADWSDLVNLSRKRVRQVLLVGQAAAALRSKLAGVAPLLDCGTIRDAVAAGSREARRGDVVLLSPGCASFDQYRNFEERGEDFRSAVQALEEAGEADA
jgi:UDP-N-acetylmuramoylalanine--D-glutamate ligase